MWIMLNDAFFSIVKKDCNDDQLLVRARRAGDIEKVFGRDVKVDRVTVADYLYRAVLPYTAVEDMLVEELRRVVYSNFKDTVKDRPLHDAYLRVWTAMAALQNPRPYSGQRYDQSLGGVEQARGTLRYPDNYGLPFHELSEEEDDADDPRNFDPPAEVPPSQTKRAAAKKRVRK